MFVQSPLLCGGEVTVWAYFERKFASSSFVVTNITQVTHPLAPLGCEGALHPQTPGSTVVEVIWHAGELLTTDRTCGNSLNTFLTKQVTTTGLNRFQHDLKADRTLYSLEVLLCLFYK